MNTKEKIVQTALKLFLSKGINETSMNEIAEEIGVSKPAIYHHFKNKDTLIEAIFDHFTARMARWSQENITRCANDQEKIHTMFSSISTFAQIEKILLDDETKDLPYSYDMFVLLVSRLNDTYKTRISQDFINTQSKLSEMFAHLQAENKIRDDIDPPTLALMMHSVLEGASFLGEIIDGSNLKNDGEKLYKAFWKLIETKTEE